MTKKEKDRRRKEAMCVIKESSDSFLKEVRNLLEMTQEHFNTLRKGLRGTEYEDQLANNLAVLTHCQREMHTINWMLEEIR